MALRSLMLVPLLSALLAAGGEGDLLKLPPPPVEGASLAEALKSRRSVRVFDPEGPGLVQAAALLWAAQGVNRPDSRRTVPSAGATYPLELYLVTEGSKDLPRGVYQYLPKNQQLLRRGDRGVAATFRDVTLQNWVKSAPAAVVVAATASRTSARYGERGLRYVHFEAGAAAQALALQAAALGLGSGIAGAFDEAGVKRALALAEGEEPLLILPVGRPRG